MDPSSADEYGSLTRLPQTLNSKGGAPIGYFNWDMLNQAFVQGIESVVLFGGAYLGMEYAFEKGWISRFD